VEWFPIKRTDRYVVSEMVVPMIAGTLLFAAVVLANVIVKSSETILQLDTPWHVTVRWLGYRLPIILTLALPVGAMLATALVVIRLGRDNELTALRMGGLSVRRMFAPFYLVGLLTSAFAFVNNEYLAPPAARRANELFLGSILRGGGPVIKNNATFRAAGESFCHVSRVDLQRDRMEFVLIYRLQDGRPKEALCATAAEREQGQWVLRNGQHSVFNDDGSLARAPEPFDRYPVQFADNIVDMWEDDKDPQAMTLRQVQTRLALAESAGDNLNAVRLRYYLHAKWSIPVTCLVFTLLAAPLSLRFARPGSHPFAGVLLTIAVVFFCNGTINWARTIALSGAAWMPPELAAWAHVAVFGGLALVLLARAER
jgi:LPS export ABC transporter permease LptG